jgi:hypothetical protein
MGILRNLVIDWPPSMMRLMSLVKLRAFPGSFQYAFTGVSGAHIQHNNKELQARHEKAKQ